MSTLRTYNLQNPDSSNVNIELTQGSGAVVAGVATFSSDVRVSGNLTVDGVLTYDDVTNIDSVGIITANAGIYLDDSIIHLGDTNTKIRFPAADTITAETSGSERLRIASNGRIGIATDNPQAILDVEGTLVVGTSGVANGNTTLNGHVIVDRTGVSGSNPSLSVYSGGSSVFYVNGGGSVYASGVNATGGITAGTSGQGNGNSNIYGYLSVDRSGIAASNTWFQVKNGNTPILFANGNGKFGVGTNNPSVNLHVKGSASNGQIYLGGTGAHSQIYADNDGVLILNADQGNSAANSYLGFNVDNTERLRITSAGKLTVTPADTTSSYATTDGGIDIAQIISSTGTSDSQSIGIQFNLTKSGQTGAIAEIGAIREGSGLSGLVFRTRDNSTGRNERLRITSAGLVGIGINNPSHKLEVAYNDDDDGFVVNNINRGGKWKFATSGSNAELFDIQRYDGGNSIFRRYLLFGPNQFSVYTGSTTSSTERLRITSTGDVGINCTPHSNAGINLHIHGDNTSSEIRLTNSTTGTGANGGIIQQSGNTFYISNTENGSTVFETNGSERLRITENGEIEVRNNSFITINEASPSGNYFQEIAYAPNTKGCLYLENFAYYGSQPALVINDQDTNNARNMEDVQFHRAGTMRGYIRIYPGSVTYSTSGSDIRLKKNFEDWTEDNLSKFKTLSPKLFNWIDDEDGTEKTKGFIAQDNLDKFPEAYDLTSSTDRYYFNPSGMVHYMMKALQEAATKIETMEARIAALEG